jgi:hypothetical protein
MSQFLLLVCLIASLVLPAWSLAATRLVVASGGATSGTCTVTPCTLTQGITQLVSGDTLQLSGGTYTQRLDIPGGKGGTSEGNRTTIRVEDGATVILTGSGNDFATTSANHYLTITGQHGTLIFNPNFTGDAAVRSGNRSDFVILRDFEVRNAHDHGVLLSEGLSLQLINLNVHHSGVTSSGAITCDRSRGVCHGIYIRNANLSGLILDGVRSWNNDGYGLVLIDAPSAVVRKSQFFSNSAGAGANAGGAQIIGNLSGTRLLNNVFYKNVNQGVWIDSGVEFDQNTVHGNTGDGVFGRFGNKTLRNNIAANNGVNFSLEGTGNTVSGNLCETSGSACAVVGNPLFISVASPEDYHISQSSSPAVGAVARLSTVLTDFDGVSRADPTTIGAYEFVASVPPEPLGLVAEYKCDTNANDSSGNGFHATLHNGATANGTPLVSGNSCVFDGIDDNMTSPNNAAFRPTAQFGLALWHRSTGTPTNACRLLNVGNTMVLGWRNTDGLPFCFVNLGEGALVGPTSVEDGLQRAIGCDYDGTTLRLRVGLATVASQAIATTLTYGGTEVLSMGGFYDGTTARFCPMHGDNFRFYDQAFTQQGWENIVNELTPMAGVSTSHCVWTAAQTAEGMFLGGANTDRSHVLTVPIGLRCNAKRNGSTVTEHLKWYASRNGGGFVEITDILNAAGIRYVVDTAVVMGDPTSAFPAVIPSGGFIFVPGKLYEAPIDTGAQVTLQDGEYTEMEGRFALGSPLVATDTLRIRLQRNNGAAFDDYGSSTRTMTLANPTIVGIRAGGSYQGGVQ